MDSSPPSDPSPAAPSKAPAAETPVPKSERMPSFEDSEGRLTNSVLRLSDLAFVRLYHRLIIRSASQLPSTGPAILVCNHTSAVDPMLLQAASKRMIVWMMAAEYYRKPGIGWLFRAVQAIPVERSGRDLAATRAALRALAAGRVLGVFPEGKIETSPQFFPFQTGVALMAIKANVPVYPAYLDGTQRNKSMVAAIIKRNRATVSFGPAVDFDRSSTSRESLQKATGAIQTAVEKLCRASDKL